MPYDYDKLYQKQRHALGQPSKVITDFFTSYPLKNSTVLDLGSGQGRDAIFIAKLGHTVLAVDISKAGTIQLNQDAKNQNLNITAVAADLCKYKPKGKFDIIIIDRTLHILDPADRINVFTMALNHTKIKGYILLSDEKSNIPEFIKTIKQHATQWNLIHEKGGNIFIQRINSKMKPNPNNTF